MEVFLAGRNYRNRLHHSSGVPMVPSSTTFPADAYTRNHRPSSVAIAVTRLDKSRSSASESKRLQVDEDGSPLAGDGYRPSVGAVERRPQSDQRLVSQNCARPSRMRCRSRGWTGEREQCGYLEIVLRRNSFSRCDACRVFDDAMFQGRAFVLTRSLLGRSSLCGDGWGGCAVWWNRQAQCCFAALAKRRANVPKRRRY